MKRVNEKSIYTLLTKSMHYYTPASCVKIYKSYVRENFSAIGSIQSVFIKSYNTENFRDFIISNM